MAFSEKATLWRKYKDQWLSGLRVAERMTMWRTEDFQGILYGPIIVDTYYHEFVKIHTVYNNKNKF